MQFKKCTPRPLTHPPKPKPPCQTNLPCTWTSLTPPSLFSLSCPVSLLSLPIPRSILFLYCAALCLLCVVRPSPKCTRVFDAANVRVVAPVCEFNMGGPEGIVESHQIVRDGKALASEAVDCKWYIRAPPRSKVSVNHTRTHQHP